MATDGQHRRAVIGNASNFWLHSSRDNCFDLTHPSTSPANTNRLKLTTTTTPIAIDPAKNFFLSPAFGRAKGAGHAATDKLVQHAIPAARKAGIQVVWLNWGLSESDVANMPPSVKRAFGFEAVVDDDSPSSPPTTMDGDAQHFKEGNGIGVDKDGSPRHQGGAKLLENGKDGRIYKGLGSLCGNVVVDGQEVDAGRLLMRDTWNAALYPPLDALYEEGRTLPHKPDVWMHKNRMSGMWGASTMCEEFLEREGIKTLLFTGVNTDQCVSGTFTDAFSKGYDCVMLADGCGTTSPQFSQQCIEFNAAKTWGFVITCEDLARGVNEMVGS